ncbi:uncharacterized protein LOC135838559 [Planococcus citri]|uniref:uncharacterized protein LOC135838559 n=1 Tax=Planococcus citri TaxID=170843 RepID=UPI0031F85D75
MNSFSFIFVFGLTLALAFAAGSSSNPEERRTKAAQECNATIPVSRNARDQVDKSVVFGGRANLTHEEKCFLNCVLQKVNFLDANSNIKNASGLVKFAIKDTPELANYSDIFIAQIFQISRSTKAIEDKCQKAFVIYHQFLQGTFSLAIASGLQTETGIREKIVNAVETGQKLDASVPEQVKELLGNVDGFFKFLQAIDQAVNSPQENASS